MFPSRQIVDQAVRCPGGVRAHQDLQALDVLGRDLRERQVQHRLMVGGGVRAGVPRTQQAGECLARLVRVGGQRVKPVTALVVPGRLLLLRVAR